MTTSVHVSLAETAVEDCLPMVVSQHSQLDFHDTILHAPESALLKVGHLQPPTVAMGSCNDIWLLLQNYWPVLLGNTLEWYEFAVYGDLAERQVFVCEFGRGAGISRSQTLM